MEDSSIQLPQIPLGQRIKSWLSENLKGDPIIWFVVFALCIISILVVYSAVGAHAYKNMKNAEAYLFKHSALVILCLTAMWFAHRLDYRYYSRISRFALIVSVPLLLFAFFFGSKVNDASRWIAMPFGLSFQPSDLAKLALIANLASMLSKRQQNIADFKAALVPMLIWCGIICGLIALSNFSTALLLFATCMLLMFIGRVPFKYLAMLVLIGIFAGTLALALGQRWHTVISRLNNFSSSQTEIPFQAQQSYIAIATGGIQGRGPGNSVQRNFLPLAYADFIFSIIVEEYGIVGGLTVILLYLALLYRGMIAVSKSEKAYGGLLSAGLSFALVLQAFVNIGVAVGILPITGQTLPLLSMGGTSLLFTGLSFGIIISVSRGEIDETKSEIKKMSRSAAQAA